MIEKDIHTQTVESIQALSGILIQAISNDLRDVVEEKIKELAAKL